MSREIKFRVWSKEFGRFLGKEEYALDLDGKLFFVFMDKEIPTNLFVTLHAVPPSSYTLQQFTGLKDKNDREIYEGDIVRCIDIISEVTWDNEYGCFQIICGRSMNDDLLGNHIKIIEIIGNIFENPELMGKQ
jgi:uncharacterized phage protein (TIGR01671 family)